MEGRRTIFSMAGLVWVGAVAMAGIDAAGTSLLDHADSVADADAPRVAALLAQLADDDTSLTPARRQGLTFLRAWWLDKSGRAHAAVAGLRSVVADPDTPPALRFRARLELIVDEDAAAHYEPVYAELSRLFEAADSRVDARVLVEGYATAARLYDAAGQYDLALDYASRMAREATTGAESCHADYQRLVVVAHSGRLAEDDDDLRRAIAGCADAGDDPTADALRVLDARASLEAQHPQRAIDRLLPHEARLRSGKDPAVAADLHALLARCYLALHDAARARAEAMLALGTVTEGHSPARVEALDVLWRVAREQGDYRGALEDHEQFVAADRRHVDDTRARAVAYQLVRQRVVERKGELDALDEKNQMLRLQQQVIEKSVESTRLYILLLLLVIGFFALWTSRVRRSQRRFQKLANRDSLTGIVNRQHFLDAAKTILQSCAKGKREASLLLIDLDNFKRVNDTYGHIAGDGVIRQSVEMFKLHLRPDDLFGRLGGEEFGILLDDCPIETACARAEELRGAVAGFAHAGVEITVTASFGVASTRRSGFELRRLMIDADAALYEAKRRGRNCVEMYADGDGGDAAGGT